MESIPWSYCACHPGSFAVKLSRMIRIVWEFRVLPGREREFERHYCDAGTWVQFFRRDPAFRGTELVRDTEDPLRYLTFDQWTDIEAYESFRVKFRKDYDALDSEMEPLIESERRLGVFKLQDANASVSSSQSGAAQS
jgi:quinol monooxygenase YgiN